MDRLHLPELSISRFRGIESLKIGRLGRVTLLTGRNAVGKTTVLEAVRVFASRRLPEVQRAAFGDIEPPSAIPRCLRQRTAGICARGFAQASNELESIEGALVRIEKRNGDMWAVEYSEEGMRVAAEQGIEVR